MKKQPFQVISYLPADLKHARVQLHGGPPALVSLRISAAFSRCK